MSWQTTTSLFDYQQEAVKKMMRTRVGALFMDMRTGKTRTAIEIIKLRQHRISRVIWFCPVSLKQTAESEILKHTNCQANDIYVFDEKTEIGILPMSAKWFIVGIESVSASDRVALAANHLIDSESFVVVDESSYIKGHNAIRTRRITHYAKKARYRLILNGTPVTQGVVDLYAQMMFLSPLVLGYQSFYSFAANHLEYSDKYPGLIICSHNVGYLVSKMEPYIFQVQKSECLDLPPKTYEQFNYLMTEEQQKFYGQAKNEILLDRDMDEINPYTIFQLFTALQQIVCGFWNRKLPNRSREFLEFPCERLEMLRTMIGLIPNDDKVVIWTKFRYNLTAIAKLLTDIYGDDAVSFYHGGLSESARNDKLMRFRASARFFLATPATGGHGLDLMVANQVIFYDNEFRYSNRVQTEDRCYGIGQDRHVTYMDIVCRQSIDGRIMESQNKKENVRDSLAKKILEAKKKGKAAVRDLINFI